MKTSRDGLADVRMVGACPPHRPPSDGRERAEAQEARLERGRRWRCAYYEVAREGVRREPRSVERSVELLAFSHSSSGGLNLCAMFAASVAWRQSAPPSDRTVTDKKRSAHGSA